MDHPRGLRPEVSSREEEGIQALSLIVKTEKPPRHEGREIREIATLKRFSKLATAVEGD